MPAAWSYLKKNVLPPLRRVELTIGYGAGSVVEQRTMIPQAQTGSAAAARATLLDAYVVDRRVR